MSLQHVALETRRADIEAEVRFWALLAFEQVAPPGTLAERSTWMQRAGAQIHLLHAERPAVMPEGHVAVVCADYDAMLGRLRAAGLSPERRTEHWGAPRCFVRTPAGHRVEITAAAP